MDWGNHKDILVFVEQAEGKPVNVGLEALAPARTLAGLTGGSVLTLVVGTDNAAAAEKAAVLCDGVLSVEGAAFGDGCTDAFACALEAVVSKYAPAAVLAGAVAVLGTAFSPLRLGLYALSLAGATFLNFVLFYAIALLGFWLTEIRQLFGTIAIVILVASGGVFPLDIFGPVGRWMAAALPFGYTTQFCVNIVTGRLAPGQIALGFAAQWLWAGAFTALCAVLWRQGAKRYTAVGG